MMDKSTYIKYQKKIDQLGGKKKFSVKSNSFKNNETIPDKHLCKENGGENISPQLKWKNVPESTETFAVIVKDKTHKLNTGKNKIHWMLFNIPPDVTKLKENIKPKFYRNGENTFGTSKYEGMCSSESGEKHTYLFEVYALNRTIDLENPTYTKLMTKIKMFKLKKATLTGIF
jgi:Raf kinase inhibitor-like YbhB/YbcL family protein